MDKQTLILQNNFDQAYNEYRQYKELLESEPPIDRDSLTKFAEENQENFNLVVEEIFNRQSIPSIKRADLISLQINLKNIFNYVKDVLELPQEVREEIQAIELPKRRFRVTEGAFEPVDKKELDTMLEVLKESYKGLMQKNE